MKLDGACVSRTRVCVIQDVLKLICSRLIERAWSPGSHDSLFVPKRANRIETSGVSGRHHASENRDDGVERVRGGVAA